VPKHTIFATITFMLVAIQSFAITEWDIQCNATQTGFDITVNLFNQFIQEGDVTGYELLFEQTPIGSCESPEIFLTVPLHAPLTYAEYSFSRPVSKANLYYRFNVLVKRPDGSVVDFGFHGAPSWDMKSCGDAVAARGKLVNANNYADDTVRVILCSASCNDWPCTYSINMSQIPEEQWRPFVDTDISIDIYGRFLLYPMPGGSCLLAESWLPTATEDCEPVALENQTWGSLKAKYR